jgi:hypothetical protein
LSEEKKKKKQIVCPIAVEDLEDLQRLFEDLSIAHFEERAKDVSDIIGMIAEKFRDIIAKCRKR